MSLGRILPFVMFGGAATLMMFLGSKPVKKMAEPVMTPFAREAALQRLRDRIVTVSRFDVGRVVETTKNRSAEIDQYLRALGLEPGQNWCAAWLHDVVRRANSENLDLGVTRSGGAKATGQSFQHIVKPRQATPETVPPGSVPFWDRSDPTKPETSWWGHIGFVDHWEPGGVFLANEGNSGPLADRVATMRRTLTDPRLLGFGVWT